MHLCPTWPPREDELKSSSETHSAGTTANEYTVDVLKKASVFLKFIRLKIMKNTLLASTWIFVKNHISPISDKMLHHCLTFPRIPSESCLSFNAVRPSKLMDGRERTETLAPFIKTRATSWGSGGTGDKWGPGSLWGGGWDGLDLWRGSQLGQKRTGATYSWSMCAPLPAYYAPSS